MQLVRQNKTNVTVTAGTWYAVIVAGDTKAVFAGYDDASAWFVEKWPAMPAHEICAVTIT